MLGVREKKEERLFNLCVWGCGLGVRENRK